MIHPYDIHSHRRAPYPEGVVNLRVGVDDLTLLPGQRYSVGIHPWDLEAPPCSRDFAGAIAAVEELAADPRVVAIGETGIDTLRGAPMFQQLKAFREHIAIAERFRKPLVVHDVRAHDIIVSLRRELRPEMPWIIHGFRGKPTVARMLLDAGCSLSFGEKFNPDSLRIVPDDRLFAETDESPLPIAEIIARIEAARRNT